MKRIEISGAVSKGLFALVDDEDYEELNQYKWNCSKGYACRHSITKPDKTRDSIRMHREVMHPAKNLLVDHINFNKLDNRKENLRICTVQQNNANRRPVRNGYKGIHYVKSKNFWVVQVSGINKHDYIGNFKEERYAAMCYDLWAKYLFGEFAYLNFPNATHTVDLIEKNINDVENEK